MEPPRKIKGKGTIQEFQGVKYYYCGRYFQRDGVRLHRVVWEAFNNQEIPDKHHVHHVDGDRFNNHPRNLQVIRQSEHLSLHGKDVTDKQKEARSRNSRIASEGNKRIPKKQRSKTSKAVWVERKKEPPRKLICQQCGKEYETHHKGVSKFCHQNCKQRALHQRRREAGKT